MTNVFGEIVKPRELTFEWQYPILTIKSNGKFFGMMMPNGVFGHSFNLNFKLGEPVLHNLNIFENLSVSEMEQISEYYDLHMAGRDMLVVIASIAKEKNITLHAAASYLSEKNFPCYSDPLAVKIGNHLG